MFQPEPAFQKWYQQWAAKAGIDPNPDNPLHRYDYRAAYRAGVVPQIDPSDGRYHWPSKFKADDHPNRYVNGQDTKNDDALLGLPPRPARDLTSVNPRPKRSVANLLLSKLDIENEQRLLRGLPPIPGLPSPPVDWNSLAVLPKLSRDASRIASKPLTDRPGHFRTLQSPKSLEVAEARQRADVEQKERGLAVQEDLNRNFDIATTAASFVPGPVGVAAMALWGARAGKRLGKETAEMIRGAGPVSKMALADVALAAIPFGGRRRALKVGEEIGEKVVVNQHTMDLPTPDIDDLVGRLKKADPVAGENLEKFMEGSAVRDVQVHGTRAGEFNIFNVSDGLGIHVGTSGQAAVMSTDHGRSIATAINIKKPLELRDLGDWAPMALLAELERRRIPISFETRGLVAKAYTSRTGTEGANTALRGEIEKAGYDGIVYLNEIENIHGATLGSGKTSGWSYIAFKPEQVKSVLGNKHFNPTNPDMFGTVPGEGGPAILAATAGSIGGGATGAAIDDEHPLRGAALGATGGLLGGFAVGGGFGIASRARKAAAADRELLGIAERRSAERLSDADYFRMTGETIEARDRRIAQDWTREIPVRDPAALAAENAEREAPLNAYRKKHGIVANERGSVGYKYRIGGNPTSEYYGQGKAFTQAEQEGRRFSALDKFIQEGEFGRKIPKTLQQWEGWLKKNVGKAGYSKEEFEGYIGPALRESMEKKIRFGNDRRAAITSKELLEYYDNSPLTLQEKVFGDIEKRLTGPYASRGKTLTLERYIPKLPSQKPRKFSKYGDEWLEKNEAIRLSVGGHKLPEIPPFVSRELRHAVNNAVAESNDPLRVIAGLKERVNRWTVIDRMPDKQITEIMAARNFGHVKPAEVRKAFKKLREDIIALPDTPKPPRQGATAAALPTDAIPLSGATHFGGYPTGISKKPNYREHLISAPDLPMIDENTVFKTGHWTNATNPLAHARTVDKGAGNSILHVLELQSDWLQKVRDKGAREPGVLKKLLSAQDAHNKIMFAASDRLADFRRKRSYLHSARRERAWKDDGPPRTREKASEDKAYSILEERYDVLHKKDREFRKLLKAEEDKVNLPPINRETQTGVRMLTKSLLERAVKEGYKKMSFSRGKDAADMFNLRQIAKRLELKDNVLKVFPKDGSYAKSVFINSTYNDGQVHTLEEYVGKEVAQMLREKGALEGGDFYDAGRAGLAEFYDRIVPETVKSYVKELTGKAPEWVTPSRGNPYLVITKAIKDAVTKGQVLPGLAIVGGGAAAISENDKQLLGIKP